MNGNNIIETFLNSEWPETKQGLVIEGCNNEFNRILFSILFFSKENFPPLKEIRRVTCDKIDSASFRYNENETLLILFPADDKTVKQIIWEKQILANICKKNCTFIALFSILHPHLTHNDKVYPEYLIGYPKNGHKKIFIPENKCKHCAPIILPNMKIGASQTRQTLFNILISCLYPPDQYFQVKRIKDIKNTAFLFKIKFKDKSLSYRYEVVKIDTISKIRKEQENFNILHCNRTTHAIYQIKRHAEFPGEFLGAIRSSAESSTDLQDFNVVPAGEYLETHSAFAKKLFLKIQANLKTIYSIEHIRPSIASTPAFPVYQKQILPEIMTIHIPWGLSSILVDNSREISTVNVGYLSSKLELKEKTEKICFLEVLDIQPDIEIRDRCYVVLKALDDNSNPVQIRWIYQSPGWQEDFIHCGIKEGAMIGLDPSNIDGVGYFLQLYNRLQEIDILDDIRPTDPKAVIYLRDLAQNKNPQENDRQELKNFLDREYLKLKNNRNNRLDTNRILNPLRLIDCFSNQTLLLLKETTGPCHGDLNLSNILVYMKNGAPLRKQAFETRLIDLASFGTEFPLSFDYVKLEAEIKNHLLAEKIHAGFKENINRQDIKKEYIQFIFEFENLLWKAQKTEKLPMEFFSEECKTLSAETQALFEDTNHPNKKNALFYETQNLFHLICLIRKTGKERYKSNDHDASILYQQQLFFYSIRTLTYQQLKKHSHIWAFLSAACAADNLDLKNSKGV
jgi:hypothetical protein